MTPRHLPPDAGLSVAARPRHALRHADFAWQSAVQAPHGSPLAVLPAAARVELGAHRQGLTGLAAIGASGHWNELRAAEELDRALSGWFHTAVAPHPRR